MVLNRMLLTFQRFYSGKERFYLEVISSLITKVIEGGGRNYVFENDTLLGNDRLKSCAVLDVKDTQQCALMKFNRAEVPCAR